MHDCIKPVLQLCEPSLEKETCYILAGTANLSVIKALLYRHT